MKILFLITKAEVGGAQVFVANLIKGLKDKSNDIIPTIACGDGDFLFDFSRKEKIDFYKLDDLKRTFNFKTNIRFFLNFYKFIKKNKFDVVHLNSTNTLLGAISVKLANKKIKTIFTVHGLSILDKNYKINFIKRFIFKSFFKFCFLFIDEVVFVSENNLKLAKSIGLIKNANLIYNGINVAFIEKSESRNFIFNKINIVDINQFLIGSIGRLAYPKNYEFLLKNFKKILEIKPDAILVLIGEGPEGKFYQEIIKKNNLEKHIFLLGKVDNASKYLKGLDLFILPSIYEGLSISLIEAYLSKIKVIASKVGGNEEVVGLYNCYELDNFFDFINVFNKQISSEQKICTDKNIDENKFSLNKMVDKYISIYNK